MFLRKFLWYFLYLCWDEPKVFHPVSGPLFFWTADLKGV